MRAGQTERAAFAASGFTLIEVLVSLSIMAVVLAALYSTFFTAERAMNVAGVRLERMNEARTALDAIKREAEAAMGGRVEAERFLVKDRDLYGKPASEVSFISAISLAPGYGRVTYYVKESEGRRVLMKRVSLPEGFAARVVRGEPEAEVIESVDSFLVEARSGKDWFRTSSTGDLPELVRITIGVDMGGGRTERMSIIARPRTGRRV